MGKRAKTRLTIYSGESSLHNRATNRAVNQRLMRKTKKPAWNTSFKRAKDGIPLNKFHIRNLFYRIIELYDWASYHESMKVTALVPDDLIEDVKTLSKGKNITESLIIALNEWVALQRIKALNKSVQEQPLEFSEKFSADAVREVNRR